MYEEEFVDFEDYLTLCQKKIVNAKKETVSMRKIMSSLMRMKVERIDNFEGNVVDHRLYSTMENALRCRKYILDCYKQNISQKNNRK